MTASELTAKGRRTRDQIVAAAAATIHERGVAATTLSDVREAAGVSSSQLYHYFADKQDLVRGVVEHRVQGVVEHQRALDISTLDAFRRWRQDLVASNGAREGTGGCPLGSLGADLAETDAVGRERVALGFRQWAQVIEQGLDDMRIAGELPRDQDTGQLAVGILAALQGGLLLSQVDRDPSALAAALDSVILLLELLAPQTT